MNINKKLVFFASLLSLFLPFFLGFLSVNEINLDLLKLENDVKIEKPIFKWKELFIKEVTVKSASGNDSLILNSNHQRDKILGDYFQKVEEYVNQNFGFRPLYIRFRNQLDFTFFGKAHANSVIVGKENYLFEENYIKAYYGLDFIGQDSINKKVAQIKYVQQRLEEKGKLFFIVLATGKASFYPEYIPDKYGKKVGTNNYEAFTNAFNSNGINYIDFNNYFIKQKNKSEHVLYPKTGIHWSQYTMYKALDSMLLYIEKRKRIDLPDYKLQQDALANSIPQFSDDDIEKGLNLLTKLESLNMTYPKFEFMDTKGKTKPKVLSISDSFYWQMFNLGISHHVFENGKFWFYNNAVYPDSEGNGPPVFAYNLNLFEELEKYDVVFVMATEANLYKIGFGFFELAETTLKIGTGDYQKRVDEIILTIKSTPSWLDQIKEKAKEKNISLEEMIKEDALYVYKTEILSKK